MKRKKTLYTLTALMAVIGLLIVITFGWILVEIPKEAAITFGKPSSDLTTGEVLLLSLRLLLQKDSLLKPANRADSSTPFKINPGESAFSVAHRLKQAGLVRNDRALRDFMVYSGIDTSLQSGEYIIDPHKTALEIALTLQDATPEEVTFIILPGWRLEEIAASLPTSGLGFSPDIFLEAALHPNGNITRSLEIPDGHSLEGFMFPDRYLVSRKISVDTLINSALQNFNMKTLPSLRENYKKQGLTLFQGVILASIVQREAIREEEMPMIASVFYNRINTGMKLETDPTVQYALGYDQKNKTWWKNPLSLDDLLIQSSYNTYVNFGLPPGPISNPGLSALNAVAYPAQTPYFYFRSACDGSGFHSFSETFEEHQENACP